MRARAGISSVTGNAPGRPDTSTLDTPIDPAVFDCTLEQPQGAAHRAENALLHQLADAGISFRKPLPLHHTGGDGGGQGRLRRVTKKIANQPDALPGAEPGVTVANPLGRDIRFGHNLRCVEPDHSIDMN